MRKILIGISGKECSQSAAAFVGKQLKTGDDVEVTFAHVLPNLPAVFWDEGHILSDAEKQERKKVVETWVAKQRGKIEPLMRSAVESIAKAGVPPDRAKTLFISDSTDVADSLLETARDDGMDMIVVGRCDRQGGKTSLAGSVAAKLLQKGSDIALCFVA